jgi:hypothetical protein
MRIAISGTHGTGKSTLIEKFLLTHPDFVHEPEPYLVLQEDYGEDFAAEPAADDFYRQLEFNLDRLRQYRPGEKVIYERCPVDFLAYLLALNDLRRDQQAASLAEQALDLVHEGVVFLDLIIFLPLDGMPGNLMSDAEDERLRNATDDHLVEILRDDDLNLFDRQRPGVYELRGSVRERLFKLESLLEP